MKAQKIDFLRLLRNQKKGWVAISRNFDKVIFHGKTLKETMKKASQYKDKLYYFPSGESYSNFVGFNEKCLD
ncbi:hypothetical protein HYW54_00500 [Candidatus Gottesmanbacteria bacterium]|nr:hypothetical protein [Candidatus Gottesmanbacteria bacterium]